MCPGEGCKTITFSISGADTKIYGQIQAGRTRESLKKQAWHFASGAAEEMWSLVATHCMHLVFGELCRAGGGF